MIAPAPRHGTCDLHLHSDVSDGLLAPAELAARAARAGLTALALTDHDAVDGVAALRAAATQQVAGGEVRLEVIPAIELTARVRGGPQGNVHLLGYGLDPAAPRLAAAARHNRLAKRAQIEAILRRLAKDEQVHLGLDDVAPGRAPDAYVGRNQVAAALVRRGKAKTYRHAFQRFLGDRRVPPPAVVDAAEAVAALREAGALVVLAHPTHHDLDHHLAPLLALGLDGLEVYRPHAQGGLLERIERAAREHDLLVTGGSDWHGHHPDPPLGSWRVEPARIEAFLAAVRARAPR
ncbi:MAG: PHP domain-containing protein [Planctomycetes bacterium]|nr:PHP domain-containing protein [Planctomycetota bacterium]